MSFPHSENTHCTVVNSLLHALLHCQCLQNVIYNAVDRNCTDLLHREEYDILFTDLSGTCVNVCCSTLEIWLSINYGEKSMYYFD